MDDDAATAAVVLFDRTKILLPLLLLLALIRLKANDERGTLGFALDRVERLQVWARLGGTPSAVVSVCVRVHVCACVSARVPVAAFSA